MATQKIFKKVKLSLRKLEAKVGKDYCRKEGNSHYGRNVKFFCIYDNKCSCKPLYYDYYRDPRILAVKVQKFIH